LASSAKKYHTPAQSAYAARRTHARNDETGEMWDENMQDNGIMPSAFRMQRALIKLQSINPHPIPARGKELTEVYEQC
jgi:hypothetical protein